MKSCVILVIAMMMLGCQSAGPDKAAGAQQVRASIAGKIIYINEEYGYAIAECAVLLSGVNEANVYRDHRYVGKVALNGPAHFPYIAAEIIEGKIQTGDRIQE